MVIEEVGVELDDHLVEAGHESAEPERAAGASEVEVVVGGGG